MPKINIEGETTHPKEVITKGILNIIRGRLMAIKEEITAIEKDLADLRRRHKLSDDKFLQKFNNGELGDEEDFFLWESSLKLHKKLKNEESILRDVF